MTAAIGTPLPAAEESKRMSLPDVPSDFRVVMGMKAGAVRIIGDARTFEHLAAWMQWLATSPPGDSYELDVGLSFNAEGIARAPQVYVVDEHMPEIESLFHPEEAGNPRELSFHTRDMRAFASLVAQLHDAGRHASRPSLRAGTPDERPAVSTPAMSALARRELADALSAGVRCAYDRTYQAARDELWGEANMDTIESVSPVDGARCVVNVTAKREFVDAGGRRFIEMAVVARCRGFVERIHLSVGDAPPLPFN